MSITIIFIAITVVISLAAFNNSELVNKLILWPRYMDSPQEYYRLLSSGFIHADWNHLLMNMFSLYFMGPTAEAIIGAKFVPLYITGIIVASLPSFFKHRNNGYYRSLGASGGVSAVLFLVIYYLPWAKLQLLFLPGLGFPCILYGALYLGAEVYMSKRGQGNVNHDAHIWGAVYGLVFGLLTDPTHGLSFIGQLLNP